jgi:hypothetical protein
MYSSIGCNNMINYIGTKHNLSHDKLELENANLIALQGYMSGIGLQQRAAVVKEIHDWIHIYSSLCCQGKEASLICTQCSSSVETSNNVRICPDLNARISQSSLSNLSGKPGEDTHSYTYPGNIGI